MFLLMAPRGTDEKGPLYGHRIVDGKMMVFRQFWWHYFRKLGWRDITPPEWGGSSVRPAGLKKLLHIHHSAIGDMLFITPLFRAFAKKYPGISQTVITGRKGVSVLEDNPWISEIRLESDTRSDTVIEEFADVLSQFDEAINYNGMLTLFPESELMNVYDLAAEWAGIELADSQKKPEIYFNEREQDTADALLASWGLAPGDNYVVMQYDASSNMRALPHGTTVDLAERLAADGRTVILFGQGNLGKKVSWRCPACGRRNFTTMSTRTSEINAICPCGESSPLKREGGGASGIHFIDSESVNIRTIALLIKGAEAFIGPDSCGIHLAACFDRPSLGIYFSFDGDLRMRYYRNARCMQVDAPCGPCFQHGKKRCRYRDDAGFSRCVERLAADSIYREFSAMMKGRRGESVVPFVPPPARACPVCASELRYYVCRKKTVCYYECLHCGAFYSDLEVDRPAGKLENSRERHLVRIAERREISTGQFLHRRFFKAGATVLEVGCGLGHTIGEMQRLGWEAWGVEPSAEEAEECMERYPSLAGRITCGQFMDLQTDRHHDLIWMNKVFESFHRPREVFRRAFELLSDRGVLAMQVIDGDEWRKDSLRARWRGVNASYAGEYSVIADEGSLKYLGREFGFEYLGRDEQNEPGMLFVSFRKS
jgi:ADP-heptose:LPS heptosyltransferase/SAM-dependent methyltransferase